MVGGPDRHQHDDQDYHLLALCLSIELDHADTPEISGEVLFGRVGWEPSDIDSVTVGQIETHRVLCIAREATIREQRETELRGLTGLYAMLNQDAFKNAMCAFG